MGRLQDKPSAQELPPQHAGYDIELKDVVFGYRDEQLILQVRAHFFAIAGVRLSPMGPRECDSAGAWLPAPEPLLPGCAQGASLKVPAGSSCAFVGTSGSGKSTIMRLLFRFYDVDAGAVLVGGTDVRDIKLASLRAAVAQVPQVGAWTFLSPESVPLAAIVGVTVDMSSRASHVAPCSGQLRLVSLQDMVLFNDTIFYNISYGRPGASAEEVYDAARRVRPSDLQVAQEHVLRPGV